MLLPVDDLQVIKADDDENDRGLLVKLLEDGSYEVAYWYDDVEVYPVEVVVDGESVKKDARKVEFKFHPELSKEDVATAVAAVSSNIFPSNKLNTVSKSSSPGRISLPSILPSVTVATNSFQDSLISPIISSKSSECSVSLT